MNVDKYGADEVGSFFAKVVALYLSSQELNTKLKKYEVDHR